jgi:DNA-binding transcriptional MerR regulator
MDATARTWRIGELAARTALSVRTLHHYDAIGLLVPAERSEAGHRRYGPADVRRLYRVLALRQLGLPLERIAAVLEGEDGDPLATVRRHLAEVDADLARLGRLRTTLAAIVAACETDEQPSPEAFLTAIEEMTMHSRYFTPEQQEQLAQRREALGDAAIEDYQRQWAELIDQAAAQRAAGADPASPPVQVLAARWRSLIEVFTGGDPGIKRSITEMYEQEGAPAASRGAIPDQELMDYMRRAFEAGASV